MKTNGSIWSFGSNTYGQLGNNSYDNKIIPTQFGIGSQWSKISAGALHSLALKNNNTLFSFGNNDYGQLGNNNTSDCPFPIQIGGSATWSNISAGYYHSFTIKSDNSILGSGNNDHGQIGDNSVIGKQIFTLIECSTLSINEFENNHSHLILYPNPTSGLINIEKIDSSEIINIEVYDMNTRLVYTNPLKEDISFIDLNTLNKGVYFIKIITNNYIVIKKIIKKD